MHIFKNIVREFLYGGHLLSLGATGVIITVIVLTNTKLNLILALIPYLSTQIIYSYNHKYEILEDKDSNPERTEHLFESTWTKYNLRIYTLLLVISLLGTNILTLLFVLCIGAFGILYTTVFKMRFGKYLVGSKNIYTALFWSVQIFLVPFYFESSISPFYLFLFWIIFMTAFINSVFFDIKDVASDRKRSIKTLPVVFGINKTIYILLLLKIAMLIPLLLGLQLGHLPPSSIFFLPMICYGVIYILTPFFVDGTKLRKISYIIADGEYFLWPILAITLSHLLV